MTKKILAVLVVLVLAGTVGLIAGCGGNLPKDAMAKVGTVIITKKAFDQRLADFETQYAGQIPDKTENPEQYKVFQQKVLDYMVTYELASQAAKDMKIVVTDEETQKEIDSILKDSFDGDQAKFDDALAKQGITMDQLENSYKESMLMQKVYDEVTKKVAVAPDNEVQSYYDANKSDYSEPETRVARHILLTPAAGRVDATTSTTSSTTSTSETTGSSAGSTGAADTSTATTPSSTTTTAEPTKADWDSALAAAKEVRAQLLAGADWTTEAKTYSDDPGSKNRGGDLGTVSKGEMVKEFEDALFSLKKDEISQPVKTAYGYHIIQVTAVNEAKQYGLDDDYYGSTVREQIKSSLLSEKKSKTWLDWINTRTAKVGVVYAKGWETTPTTQAGATGSTDTAAPSSDTTAASSTSTTAGNTITTAGATETTGR